MENNDASADSLKRFIRDIPDYPKKGILFRDITPLLKDGEAFSDCIALMQERLSKVEFDYVVGIEARGFIIGAALANRMGKGFIPIRKKGKLPHRTARIDYTIEYGKDTMEIHTDAVKEGNRVVIADDLLATGGTANAAAELVRGLGAEVAAFAFVIELDKLDGRKMLGKGNIISLLNY